MGRRRRWGLSTCDCAAAYGADGRFLHSALSVLQGLSQGAGVRELVHQPQLHLSEGAGMCLQCGRNLSLNRPAYTTSAGPPHRDHKSVKQSFAIQAHNSAMMFVTDEISSGGTQ